MVWRVLLGVALILFAMLFGFFYYLGSRGVSEEELLRRCETAQPTWQGYQEDIKSQIGAGPVAEWGGRPVEARFSTGEIEVLFEIRGEWAAREAALPMLLRVPTGEVIVAAASRREGARHLYRFMLGQGVGQPPWAELRYPRQTVRMLPDENGLWKPSESRE